MCNMKRISYLIATAAMFVFSMAAYAQESAQTEYNSSEELYEMMDAPKQLYKGDFFVGIGGGANVYFGENDRQMKFQHRIAPAMDVYVGKWITPSFGLRFTYSGGQAFGLSNWWDTNAHSTGTRYQVWEKDGDCYWLDYQEFNHFGVRVDALLNVMSLFAGDNPERVYNLSPYVGFGVHKVYNTPLKETCVGLTVGLFNTFRISDSWDIVLDVHATAVPEKFEYETGSRPGVNPNGIYSYDGILTAALGVSYSF